MLRSSLKGPMSGSSWNILNRLRLATSCFSALLTRCHLGLLPKSNRASFRDGILLKEGIICSTSDFVFGNNSAGVLSALQYLKTEKDRRIFGVGWRTSEQIKLPGLGGM